jgi:hypothetical protein
MGVIQENGRRDYLGLLQLAAEQYIFVINNPKI